MERTAIVYLPALLLFLACIGRAEAQQTAGYHHGPGGNPSFAGSEGTGKLRMIYGSTYPGSGYNLNSFHLSFDTFYEPVHGGAGFSLTSEHPGGLMNDIRGSVIYSYHLQASRELYFFAGMSAGVIYRSFNSGKLIFPDQIDPLNGAVLPGNEVIGDPSSLFFTMGTGFMMVYRSLVAAVDIANLFQPDLTEGAVPGAGLPRTYTMQVHSRFGTANKELFLSPYAELSSGGDNLLFAAGGTVEYGRAGVGVSWISEAARNSFQTTLKAGHGNIDYLYSFRFSPFGKYPGLPFVVMHQAGIHISLNIVNKRNTIKTIFFPHL
jgi:type IX secretion system PorP/SprF family membrane protein